MDVAESLNLSGCTIQRGLKYESKKKKEREESQDVNLSSALIAGDIFKRICDSDTGIPDYLFSVHGLERDFR